jgi:tRNA pseudouridine55 synthase
MTRPVTWTILRTTPMHLVPEVVATPRRFRREIDGILLLDKALGVSSNAALQQVRALFGAAKAGHAGSLDPLASGMLPICFGQATKVCGRLLAASKTYRVTVQLGARTESLDCETPVIERLPTPALTESEVDATLAAFTGEQDQVPPMHSAVKHEGKRLYELARRGESVDRSARRIVIHRLQRIGSVTDRLEFEVDCSKGTYIRTLAADIAQRLGTIGYVSVLRRTAVEPFSGPMYTLDGLTERADRDALLLATDTVFQDLPATRLDELAEKSLMQGQAVAATPAPAEGQLLRAYAARGRFLGLVEGRPHGRVQPVRLFVSVE